MSENAVMNAADRDYAEVHNGYAKLHNGLTTECAALDALLGLTPDGASPAGGTVAPASHSASRLGCEQESSCE